MVINKSLRDISKLSDDERLLIIKTRLEKAQKEKNQLESSLKETGETIAYFNKKIDSLQNKNDNDPLPQNFSNKKIERIRRSSHDRVKVNLYLAESLRSKLDNLNTTQKPLAQFIRGSLDNYFSNPEYKKSIDQYLSEYESHEKILFKNKNLRKTFVVAIEKENLDILHNLSKSTNKDVRFFIESILFHLPEKNL